MPRCSKYGALFIDPYGRINIYGGNSTELQYMTLSSLNAEWSWGGAQYLNQGVYAICSVQVLIFYTYSTWR